MKALSGMRVLAIVLIGALASGCVAGGYNANSLRERLVEAGLSPSQASCVIDKMVERFGDEQLNARKEAIAAEISAERLVLRKCGVATAPR